VAIVVEGRLRSAGRIEARPEALELFAQILDPGGLGGAGSDRQCVARILEPHVTRVVVVSPSDTGLPSGNCL
jgi:hypothetical protein